MKERGREGRVREGGEREIGRERENERGRGREREREREGNPLKAVVYTTQCLDYFSIYK